MLETIRIADCRMLAEPGLLALFDLLEADGEEARIAGGAVRNLLMGHPEADIDIATTALPKEVMRRARRAGLKVVPTGIDHGTVTVISGGVPYEVTTLRRDVETDGRRAVVAYSRSWPEDAERRDFTINGLFMDRHGVVYDYVGGLADIETKTIRFIGSAEDRIREDYLRTMRFFRFHAAYGVGDPDPSAMAAIAKLKLGTDRVAKERIRVEVLKMLATRNPLAGIAAMQATDVAKVVFGARVDIGRMANLLAVENMLGGGDPVRRLAALALSPDRTALHLRELLKLTNAETTRLETMEEKAGTQFGMRQDLDGMLFGLGEARTGDVLSYAWSAATNEETSVFEKAAEIVRSWRRPIFPLSGSGLIARGIPQGAQVGKALERIQSRWIAEGFPSDPQWMEYAIETEIAGKASQAPTP